MAWRAGFHHIRLTEPASDTFHSHDPIHLTLEASTLGSFKLAAINLARQRALVRRLRLWWRYLMGQPLISTSQQHHTSMKHNLLNAPAVAPNRQTVKPQFYFGETR